MTNQGVNFHLPPGGQISAAVDNSSFEPHAEDLLGQLDSCRWSENAERERA
jgi:hypothetical protein